MSMNPLNDISKVYMKEVLKPQIGKPAEKGGEQKRGGTDEESSAKRIRQAVYDIRYRAKEKNLELPQAYAQYIGGSQMSGEEKNAVKEKLGLSESVVSEEEERYSVRITDKEGKTKYEKKTRTQISALRADPTISSVEMSKSGGASKPSGKLDPVGKEDSDVDNDGDVDKSDKYLMNRRKAIGKAMAKENKFYSWRESLIEVTKKEKEEGLDDDNKRIKEKKDINNVIRVNPVVKEEIEALGGIIIESQEDAGIFSGILEVDYYHMTDELLESVLHEFYDECLEEGLDLLEVRKEIVRTLAIESELLDEATVSTGHDTKIPKKKDEKTNKNVTVGHDSTDKDATRGVGPNVKKEKMGTLRTLAKKAYNVSPKKVVDKTKDAYNSETGKRIRSGLKKGLKRVGKRLSKTADNIAGRMFSEQGPSQDSNRDAEQRRAEMAKTQGETQRKQALNTKERLMKKQQMLDRQRVQMQKQGKLPTSRMEEVSQIHKGWGDAYASIYEKKLAAPDHDPVGQEDKDIDNDGDHDKTDKYLLNRRKVIGKVIGKKKNEKVEQIDEISANLALTASQKADEMRRKASLAGDKETAAKKAGQASRLYKGVGPRRAKERMKEETEQVDEKLNLKKADMGDVVKDFYKSDAPQFKGKTKKERQKMAIAAKLTAERGGKKLGEESLDERTRYAKETGKDPQTGKPSEKGGTLGGDDRHSKVMRHMKNDLRKSGGLMSSRGKPIKPQGQKQEKGAKGYQGVTPVDKIKANLARKRAPKPDIGSRYD